MTEPMSTDLVYASASLEERKKYAEAIARAGSLLPKGLLDEDGKPSPGKVLLIAETGNMLSIHPIAALNGVNVIEGKPTISPALMSALVRRAGHKLRVTTAGTIEGGDFQASATLIRADDPHHPYVSTWTPHRAARAGLCTYSQDPKTGRWIVRAQSKYGKPLPWESYTEALCKARAIGEACRDGAEDALMGVHYSAEELGATVNEAGDVIDGEIIEDEPEPGHTGESRARLRDPAVTGPEAERTPTGGSRPRPPRPVTSPGTGRATPTPEPTTEQAATVAEFVDAITETDSVNALRVLHDDADKAGLLALPTANGVRLNDLFHARKAYLQRRDVEPDTEDVPLDIEEPV